MSPLNKKGRKVKAAMAKTYGSKKKGEQVFYASVQKGTVKNVERKKKAHGKR